MDYSKLIAYCKTLPHANWEVKWTNALAFMVGRKMFALFILDGDGKATDLWCKADDELFLSYTGQRGIRPAPYLARARWIALEVQAMSTAQAKRMLRRSRDLVFMKLPKRVQREMRAPTE
jgi:predicted DNA-binding protein (MmcQ/YjbR family)